MQGVWLVVGAACAIAMAQGGPRSQYQQVITQQYPGFRILPQGDLVQQGLRDGTSGTLIVGAFNYDQYRDFAAIIIGADKHRYEDGVTSYDYFDGKLVVCFGASNGKAFQCEAEDRPTMTLPHPNYLQRIPPGRYECLTETPRNQIVTTTIDSVGQVFGEVASSFQVRNRDGSTFDCITSDWARPLSRR